MSSSLRPSQQGANLQHLPPLFQGKVGVVMGVANQFSIATGVAQVLRAMGAELALSYLPDPKGKMARRVRKVVDPWKPGYWAPCDVLSDASIADFFEGLAQTYAKVDFLVHSIAYAPLEDLKKSTLETSRQGFLDTMNVSVYSFIACLRAASEVMKDGGSVVTMSYYGGEKVIPGYNIMGVAKSALEAAVRYSAYDLGPRGIRVNAISSGPVKTLAASAVGVSKIIQRYRGLSPLQKNISQQDVGLSAAYLLSDLARSTTGEVLHVDAGYHVMGLCEDSSHAQRETKP